MLDKTESPESQNALLEGLLGRPPLMRGEDEGQYWRLHQAVEYELEPETDFDRICVRELTDKLWEKRRNKQSVAALVETSYTAALIELLKQSLPPSAREGVMSSPMASTYGREYFDRFTPPEERAKLNSMMDRYGITPGQIRAKAMEICGPFVSVLRRFDDHDDKAIRRIYKDYERRIAKKKRAKSSSVGED